MFHKTTPDLQDQDRSVQDQDHSHQDQDRIFGSQAGLVLRPMVSDHITGYQIFRRKSIKSLAYTVRTETTNNIGLHAGLYKIIVD